MIVSNGKPMLFSVLIVCFCGLLGNILFNIFHSHPKNYPTITPDVAANKIGVITLSV
jgi:hypothetical protein